MKKKVLASLLGFTLLAILFVLFTGCPNFMEGNDVKNVISAEVAEANAPEISIRIQPLSSEMGTTTPNGVITQKVGIPFTVSTLASSEYAFIGWDSPVESISFEDIEAAETTVVASQAQDEEILIVSNFDARPRILTHEPFSQDGVLMNQQVTIVFSEAVDPSTVNFDNISVVAKRRNTTDEPVSMTDRLKDPVVSGSNVELQFEGSNTYDAQNYVIVTLAKAITDLDGHQMAEDFSWSFITGSSTDLSEPAINGITLKIGVNGSEETFDENSTGIISETSTMKLWVDAVDDVLVETLQIAESELSDDGSTVIETANMWQSDYYGKDHEYSFSFSTAGDGKKRLRFTVFDPPLQESSHVDLIINLDTTAPTVSGLVLNSGNQYVGSDQDVAISVTVTDPGFSTGVGAGMGGYAVTATASEPGSWTSATSPPATIDLPSAAQGPQTLYFHAKDDRGNWNNSYMSATITIDSFGPSIGNISINSGSQYTKNSSVSYSFDTSDGADGSGIVQYQVKAVDAGSTGVTPDAGSWTTYGTPQGGTVTGSGTAALPAGDGEKTIYIWSEDAAGNRTENISASVTLDTSGPVISNYQIDSTIPSGTIYTNGNSVSVTFNVADAGIGFTDYEISASDGTFSGTNWQAIPGGGAVSTTVSTTANDTYTIKARARDSLDNITASIPSATVIRDNIQPDITGFTIGDGSGYTNQNSISVEFTLGDTGGSGIKEYWVSDQDGTYSGDWVSSSAGAKSVNVNLSTDGSKTIRVKTRDHALNEREVSGSITLDQTGPDITGLQIGDGSAFTNDDVNPIDVTFNIDDGSGIGAAEYEISDQNGNFSGNWQVVTTGSESGTVALSGDGEKTIKVRGRDDLENITDPAASGTVTLDTAPPSVQNLVINGGAAYTNGSSVSVAFDLEDGTYGSGDMEYMLTVNGTPGSWTTFGRSGMGTSESVSTSVATTSDGDYIIEVDARDALQIATTSSVSGSVTRDAAPPSIDTFTLNGSDPSGGMIYTNTDPVSIVLNISDTGGSDLYQFEISDDDGVFDGSWQTVTDGSETRSLDFSADGEHKILVRVRDKALNITTYPDSGNNITLDTAPPSVQNLVINGGAAYTNGSSVSVAFDLEDGTYGSGDMEYMLTVNGTPGSWTTSGLSGTGTSESVSTSVATTSDGDYIIEVDARDALQIATTSPVSGSVTRDAESPSIGTPAPTASYGTQMELTVRVTEATSGVDRIKYWPSSDAEDDGTTDYAVLNSAITGTNAVTDPNPVPLSSLGDVNFSFRLVDQAGNTSPVKAMTGSGGTYSNITSGTGRGASPARKYPVSDSDDEKDELRQENKLSRSSSVDHAGRSDLLPFEIEHKGSAGSDLRQINNNAGRYESEPAAAGSSGNEKNYVSEASVLLETSATPGALEQPDFSAFIVTGEPEKNGKSKEAKIAATTASGDAIVSTSSSASGDPAETGGSGRGGGRGESAEADKPLNPETEKLPVEPWMPPAEAINKAGFSTGISALSPSGGPGGGPEDVPRDGGLGENMEGPGQEIPQESPPQTPPKPDLWIADDQRAESKARRFDIEGNMDGAVV